MGGKQAVRSLRTKNIAGRSWLVMPGFAFTLLVLRVVQPAQAATYYWDTSSSPGIQSGSGTWDTATEKWSSTNGGSNPLLAWTAGNDADFYTNGTSTVTVNGNQTVGNITFDGSGYTVTGGTLTMTGGTVAANQDATIGSVIIGPGSLTKVGSGTLTLSGTSSNTYSGDTNVSRARSC